MRTCPFPVLINFHSIVLASYGRYMKVTTQNSKLSCRDLQKSHFMNAIAIFSGEFPVGANPPPFRNFCVRACSSDPIFWGPQNSGAPGSCPVRPPPLNPPLGVASYIIYWMKQNGVIRNDEGVGIVCFKSEELESESSILKARSRSRSRSF